jgi:hypothetical protein
MHQQRGGKTHEDDEKEFDPDDVVWAVKKQKYVLTAFMNPGMK